MESNTSRLLNTQSLWQSYRNAVEQRSASALSSSLLKHEDVESGLLHAKQMEFVHKQYDKQIDYEKIEKMGALSIGEYDFKTNKVKVVTLKGKHWSIYGHMEDGCMWLYPEEALFLLDVSVLRIIHHSIPMSQQEAYKYLLRDNALTLNHALVFNHLSRLGYIMQRYRCPSEKDATSAAQACKRKIDEPNVFIASKVTRCYDKETDSSKEKYMPTIENSSTPDIPAYTEFDYSMIEFPEEGGMQLKKHSLPVNKESFVKVKTAKNQANHFAFHSFMDYRDTKNIHQANNWSDFKAAHQKRLEELEGNHRVERDALVMQDDITDLHSVLVKLKLSRTTDLQTLSQQSRFDHCNCLMFNVYQPNPNFRKSCPGKPQFRVKIMSSSDDFPGLADIVSLNGDRDDVPVYWAVCDGADISFYHQCQEMIIPDLYDK